MGSNQPLGTSGDLGRRLLLHHVPLALASAVLLVVFMGLPRFDANAYPHGDIFSSTFPLERGEGRGGPMDHGGSHTGSMGHGGGQGGAMDHAERMGGHSFARRFTFATGYVALGLLALTLLIGPANLLLRRRNPVSNYLSRDVGTWAAIGSVVHVIFGLQVHDSGRLSGFLMYFVAPDGSPWLNSFGLGNWTGLAALVIVVGLLAISSDAALRKLKARRWKRLQRLNYALFALVIAHAFFYGALLRMTSPFTLLLGLSVIVVFVGQAVGVWLWRRRYSRTAAAVA